MATEAESAIRFLHILAGITWIGLLYFFNVVNAPAIKFAMKNPRSIDMGAKAGPDLTLKTLWWFRWGAAFTVLFGLLLMDQVVRGAYSGDWGLYFDDWRGRAIIVGGGLGIIMAANVWFIIWPTQRQAQENNMKVAAGEVEGDAAKKLQDWNAANLPKAVMASRFNFWASIPMLFFMVFAAHGPALF